MNQKSRIENIKSYDLIDTAFEKELDKITHLASALFGAPKSLTTIIDGKHQRFISKQGIKQRETDLEDSFHRHILNKPNEVLVVNDALKDERFVNNNMVIKGPKIRFYAGAPLVTKDNCVLGTLCVIDTQPMKVTSEQVKDLQKLAKRIMDKFETQLNFKGLTSNKNLNTRRSNKITENLPYVVFELKVDRLGKSKFLFISEGMKRLQPEIELNEWFNNPEIGLTLIHPDDIEPMQKSMAYSIQNNTKLYHEYRVKDGDGYRWYALTGQPEKTEHQETIIYGSFTDISSLIQQETSLEQINSDISHILSRPVQSIHGVTSLFEFEQELSSKKLKSGSTHTKTDPYEMKKFTRKLNEMCIKKAVGNNS